MKRARLHITGASGAGTTTLGRALAQRLAIPHFDSDDFYWVPTDPPYRQVRPVMDRLRLLTEMLGERPSWVLSGSLDSWGSPAAELFDLVVWLDVPTSVRLVRIAARERVRYGDAAIAPGGRLHAEHQAFLEFVEAYDSGRLAGRSRRRHEAWLAELSCPVLRLEGDVPTEELVGTVLAGLPGSA